LRPRIIVEIEYGIDFWFLGTVRECRNFRFEMLDVSSKSAAGLIQIKRARER
jgi:hypothetical protein